MTEKLCVFCAHFDLSIGYADSFGEGMGDITCSKSHFKANKWGEGTDFLRSVIVQANKCKDYQQVKLNG